MTDKKELFLNFCSNHKPTEEQQIAIFGNKSIVAAGAGSGKTATLSQRFLYLVLSGIPADKILTITFTKDAASNMKAKIFKALQQAVEKKLFADDRPLKDFSNATICTTDSFCSEVAKMDCVRYGIPANFQIEDDSELINLSSNIVDKVLKQNENSLQLSRYLAYYSIDNIKETMLCLARNYICISDPINTEDIVSFVKNHFGQSRINSLEIELYDAMDSYLNDSEIKKRKEEDDAAIEEFTSHYLNNRIDQLLKLKKALSGNCAKQLKPHREEIKEIISNLVVVLSASDEENLELLQFICSLIDSYQKEILNHKKETGLVTFHDVMKLAIKILKTNENVRSFFCEKFDAIMVDEFQDNNEDNKDLIYLLASTKDYENNGTLDASVIKKEKFFMVGDEKQSIYKFRNADVSVFKKIADELGTDSVCKLTQNFRSEKTIIDTVNLLFEKIMGTHNSESYEADFESLHSSNENVESSISFQYLIEDKKYGESYLSSSESEAFAVAKKIYDIVNTYPEKYKVVQELPDGSKTLRNPVYSDIAILLKVGTHQGNYEKALRHYNIDIDVSESKTLTTDAVLNDIYVVLQLAVYGESDEISKYAYLRGPFCRLTEREIYLDKTTIYSKNCSTVNKLRSYCTNHSIAQVISYIWNELGYRYFIISKKENQAFEEHFDYIFRLACRFDNSNKNLVDFLDYIRPMLGSESAIKDLSIQKEEASGVKIMSVHKSKGLEFPIVFVADMQSGGSAPGGFSPSIRWSDTKKVTLPYCPIFDENKLENPLNSEKNEDTQMDNAETKRVLYVAATRAQYHLIFSGVIPAVPKNEKDFGRYQTLDIQKHHSQLDYFLNAIDFNYGEQPSFNDIEMKELSYVPVSEYRENTNKPSSSTEDDVYENKPQIPEFKKEISAVTEHSEEDTKIDKSIELAKFDVEDLLDNRSRIQEFGSLVHKMFENKILENKEEVFGFFEGDKNRDAFYKCAENLTTRFGQNKIMLNLKTSFDLYPEKPLLINVDGQLKSGVIDLLCVSKEKVVIVDYKTDRYQDISIHKDQLSTYKKAAESIFDRPVETYLYYIRSDSFIKL